MIAFHSDGVWEMLKKVAENSQRPADVAVAYFGRGAANLLPLPVGSRIVVDASEKAVASGQTHPADLAALLKRGVAVYSISNLHAKVFVFGRTAFVGSANASHHSKTKLLEAVVSTTDREAVRKAREFVREHCLDALGPEELGRLQGLYRPPLIGGSNPASRRAGLRRVGPSLPRIMLVQLMRKEPPDGSEKVERLGRTIARNRLEQPRAHLIDDFWMPGMSSYKPGDIVVQVVKESASRWSVSPPGKVLYQRHWRSAKRHCTFTYIELPRKEPIPLGRLSRRLGGDSQERLQRGGRVSSEFAAKLLAAFNRGRKAN